MSDAEVLVLGGGPAGAAAAIALARGGVRVLLVEREAMAREKVCGEFLGTDAAACLQRLGLDVAELGGVSIAAACLAHRQRIARISLPFAAWGLPRATLDSALLEAAQHAGAMLLRGTAVQQATPGAEGWSVRLTDGRVLRAPRLVLATGKHVLRGHPRARAGGAVGLKLHLRLAAPLDAVTLLPFAGGYAGLQPGPAGVANLCAAVFAGDIPTDAAALLARIASASTQGERLLAAGEPLWARPLAIAGVPYGLLHRDAADAPPRLYRIGDQFAVIPSFCGDGMAMAMAGGLAVAAALQATESAAAFHAAWHRALRRPMRVAGGVAAMLGVAPGLLTALAGLLPPASRAVARATRVRLPPASSPRASPRSSG